MFFNTLHTIPFKVSCIINSSPSCATYMRQWIGLALVEIMACRLFGAKPLSKPMLGYCQLHPHSSGHWSAIPWHPCETLIKIQNFSFTKMHLKISSANRRPFCPGGDELMKASYCVFQRTQTCNCVSDWKWFLSTGRHIYVNTHFNSISPLVKPYTDLDHHWFR